MKLLYRKKFYTIVNVEGDIYITDFGEKIVKEKNDKLIEVEDWILNLFYTVKGL
jgi:hypothetical protein